MNTTQQELIAALARRLNGQRPTPTERLPGADSDLEVLIDLEDAEAIDATGR